MRPGPAAKKIVKKWEGIRDGDPTTVNLDPYLCPADYVTIGWGHVVTHNGRMLKGRDGLRVAHQLYPNGITEEEAETLLDGDILVKAVEVDSLIEVLVTQSQFDALVSFAFNVGTDIDADSIPEGLGDSTLLKKLNNRDYPGALNEFPKWNKIKGKVSTGLSNRRADEMRLFSGREI